MAMDHRSTTSPLSSSLPAELRLMVFEQALLPLIEPRIVDVYISPDDRYTGFDWHQLPLSHFGCFAVNNGRFLRETESFVASAGTLRRVCREGRAAVQAFHRRHAQPQSQRRICSDRLIRFSHSLSVPLRYRGPHADIFTWLGFRLLKNPGITCQSAADLDLGRAKRWLVPIHTLTLELRTYDWPFASDHSYTNRALLRSPHDIIALIPANDGPSPLRYSDLIIVLADASREMAIAGIEDEDRDFILEKFEHCKESLRLFEERLLSQPQGPPVLLPPARVFPDLYFAYVNPLKRGKPGRMVIE